jgi:peptide deformylase
VPVQPIRLFGDPVLRMKAQPVTDFDRELHTLVKDLTETMQAAPGAGLAAPQIGVSLRVFTYHVDGELGHLVNPDLTLTPEQQDGPEGWDGIIFVDRLDAEQRKAALRAVREAEWAGEAAPPVRISPHGTFGAAR